jgi:hypothetical protein
MGKMTGDVSDPFCVFFVKDLRANSGVASAKKQASTAALRLLLSCCRYAYFCVMRDALFSALVEPS